MIPDAEPSQRTRLPMRLVLGLALAIALDTALQVVWKYTASDVPDHIAGDFIQALWAIARQPLFLLVAVLFVAQMVNWLSVLADADVSFALPITALSYVSVAAVSAVWLHEDITLGRVAGMSLILIGVFLISRTEHNTLNPPGPL